MQTSHTYSIMKNKELFKHKKVPFCENDTVDYPVSPYAATKKAGELLCHTYHHLYKMNIACLRFFTVYGPRQRPDLAIYKFTDKICACEPIPFFGNGCMSRDYTYIDDIVSGLLLALDWTNKSDYKYGIFNLGESNTISLTDMVKTLEISIGRQAKLQHLPAPPGDVKVTWADISKSKRILGYNPCTLFDEGIEKFVRWYIKNRG